MFRRACLLLLLVMVLSAWPMATPTLAAPSPTMVAPLTGALIVGFKTGVGLDDSDALIPRLTTSRLWPAGVSQTRPLGGNAFRLELNGAVPAGVVIEQLARLSVVRYVENDSELRLLAGEPALRALQTPNDPAWAGQDEMRRIEADRAWDLTTGAPATIIALLDTGASFTHADLAGRVLPGATFVASRGGAADDEGHGTMTASVAAGAGNNKAGMAGVCWACQILPLKVLDRAGRGSASGFVAAIRVAVDNGARVINISAGGPDRSQALEDAVHYATSKGVLVVASAGNEPDTRPNYPAAYDDVLAVAASSPNDTVTTFSTRGAFVDLAAPGVNITGAQVGSRNGVVRATGTSFSAPLVAGTAGLLLSVQPSLTLEQLRNRLTDTVVDIGQSGRDDNFGTGRLSVFDALLATVPPTPRGGASLTATVEGLSGRAQLAGAGFEPGEPLRLHIIGPQGQVRVYRNLVADGAGNLAVTHFFEADAAPGGYRVLALGDRTQRLATATLELTTARVHFQPAPAPANPDERLYFPETKHSLGGGFRIYWEKNGGLATFGFPISEEFQELNLSDGKIYTVQYFERHRFEFHPEAAGTPNDIQLGLLGALLTRDRIFPPVAATPLPPGAIYFAETRHTLSGDFRRYWEQHGGVGLFGLPISEPFTENGRLVQYFERNRFELHPELAPAFRVSLGLLGTELARRNGYIQ